MSIWTRMKAWFTDGSKPRVVYWIPKGVVQPPVGDDPIASEESYLRVWLVEMVLGKSVNWFKQQQPSVQSLTTLKFGDKTEEVPSIAAADPARYAAGASVLQNFLLLDTVPFRGNTVEMEVGLVAIPGDDNLGNALKAVSNVAGLVGAPLSAAITIANKVKESAEMLIGDGAAVHLAYHNIFTAKAGANQLRCGYLAIINADPATYNVKPLMVVNDQLSYWDGQASQPVRDIDFLLLRIEGFGHRDDMRSFSDLKALRNAALDAFITIGDEAGDKALRTALAAIIKHPELINADQRTLAQELKSECDTYRGSVHGAGPGTKPRSWEDFASSVPAGSDHAPVSIAEFI